MKKVFVFILATVLVLGFASITMAARESTFKFQGNYSVTGMHLSNVGAIKKDNENNSTENFILMKAKLKFRAYVSKTLWFTGTVKGLDKKWGRNQYMDHTHAVGTDNNMDGDITGDEDKGMDVSGSNKDEVEWTEAYISWVSPLCFIRVGRYQTDADPKIGKLGLSPVGAARLIETPDVRVDRIILARPVIKPFWSIIFLYEKILENDSIIGDYDHDYDFYYVRNEFKWKDGLFRLTTSMERFGINTSTGGALWEINGSRYLIYGEALHQFGPVTVGGSIRRQIGNLEFKWWPSGVELIDGMTYNGWSYWATAEYKQGPFWFGGSYYLVAGLRTRTMRISPRRAILANISMRCLRLAASTTVCSMIITRTSCPEPIRISRASR